jgi:hypothetical protein
MIAGRTVVRRTRRLPGSPRAKVTTGRPAPAGACPMARAHRRLTPPAPRAMPRQPASADTIGRRVPTTSPVSAPVSSLTSMTVRPSGCTWQRMRHPLTASRTQITEPARLITAPAIGPGLRVIASGVVIGCPVPVGPSRSPLLIPACREPSISIGPKGPVNRLPSEPFDVSHLVLRK